jgi:MtN3 and saliva related transmembrane protein
MADHSTANLLGVVAGTLTTFSFVPQVVKTWRTRRADDVSMGMLLLFTAGVSLWMIYGLMTGAMPVIAANGVTVVLAIVMVVLKLRC